MKKTNNFSFYAVIIILVLIAIIYYSNKKEISNNPTIDVKPNTEVQVTTIKVAKFYDGQDGYSISIPSGNSSTCVWNWEGGNAAVPYSKTTYANTATEKHTVTYYSGSEYNYKVNCFDDFGNQYTGIFPSDIQ